MTVAATNSSMPGYTAPAERMETLRRRHTVGQLIRRIESGDWKGFLLRLRKAMHAYPSIRNHAGQVEPLLVKVNIVRMAIRLHTQVLAGEAIGTSVPEGFGQQAAAILRIRDRSHLDAVLMQAVRTANIYGHSILRPNIDPRGEVVVCMDDNAVTLPVGPDDGDMQPSVWERRWFVEVRDPANPAQRTLYMRVERHSAPGGDGLIEQEAYRVRTRDPFAVLGTKDAVRVPLERAVPGAAQMGLLERVDTGAPHPLPTRLVHEYFDGQPEMLLGEHDLDLLDMSAAAISRLDRGMEQHGSPKFRVSESMINPETGRVEVGDAVVDNDKLFEYIVKQIDFEAMFKTMNKSLQLLSAQLQLSPALIGIKLESGAMPDTYDKLRLEASNTLARGKTSARYFGPALGRVLTVASIIDANLPMRGYAVAPVGVTMHPSLPQPAIETAREMAELRGAPGGPLVDELTALVAVHGAQSAPGIKERLDEERAAGVERTRQELMLGFAQGGAA